MTPILQARLGPASRPRGNKPDDDDVDNDADDDDDDDVQVISLELDTAPLLLFTLPVLLTGLGAVLGQLAAQSDTLAVEVFFTLINSDDVNSDIADVDYVDDVDDVDYQVLTTGLTNGTLGVGTQGGSNVTVVVTAGFYLSLCIVPSTMICRKKVVIQTVGGWGWGGGLIGEKDVLSCDL